MMFSPSPHFPLNKHEIKKFVSSNYYTSETEKKFISEDEKDNIIINLLPDSKKLISEYYADKYDAKISIIKDIASLSQFDLPRDKECNYRHTFLFGTVHCVPIIYIKEGMKEAVLLANSLGTKGDISTKRDAQVIKKIMNTDVFVIEDIRQSDTVSCHLDALIFGRIATAKNPVTKEYIVPNLLEQLKARSEQKGVYYSTKLPDEFLITAQISDFVSSHTENSHKIIHTKYAKKEILSEFRDRYEVKLKKPVMNEKHTKIITSIAGYNRKKAIKMANIVEIQFYLQQLKELLGLTWTQDIRDSFKKQAKECLLLQGSPTADRKGLFEFTNQFYLNLNDKKLIIQTQKKATY